MVRSARLDDCCGVENLSGALSIRNRVLEASHAFAKAVSAELQMEPLCDLVVEYLTRVFSTSTTSLLFLDDDSEEIGRASCRERV